MALFENFPYSNLQDFNLEWIIRQLKKMEDSTVISVNGQTGEVVLYQADSMQLPAVDSNVWQIIRTCDGVVCGIHFNANGTATIVNGNRLVQIYTADNPPPYPVTSVNGQTGNVTLYQDAIVKLPDLTDEQLHQWNIYRQLNGSQSGLEFADDGKVYIISGVNRYPIYSFNNPPAYPVTSVEGMTGAVTLFPDADIQFNDIDDATSHSVRFCSILNSILLGIEIADDGKAYIWKDEDKIPIYLQGFNEPSDFTDPVAPILEVVNNLSTGTQWGIVRKVGADTVGIVFVYDSVNQIYHGYLKQNNTITQLLTVDDIPSTTGVISINGQSGIVTLLGTNIQLSNTDSKTVTQTFTELKTAAAIIENDDTAINNIPAGAFILWKNVACKALSDISAGDTLSALNLEILSNGFTNRIESDIADIVNRLGHIHGILIQFQTIAELCSYIRDDVTYDIAIGLCDHALTPYLCSSADNHDGIIFILKASANNAYYMVFTRDRLSIGNLNLQNNTVSITHHIV